MNGGNFIPTSKVAYLKPFFQDNPKDVPYEMLHPDKEDGHELEEFQRRAQTEQPYEPTRVTIGDGIIPADYDGRAFTLGSSQQIEYLLSEGALNKLENNNKMSLLEAILQEINAGNLHVSIDCDGAPCVLAYGEDISSCCFPGSIISPDYLPTHEIPFSEIKGQNYRAINNALTGAPLHGAWRATGEDEAFVNLWPD